MRLAFVLVPATALAAALAVQPAAASSYCAPPRHAPAMPDGSTASKQDMQAARSQVQAYVNALEAYQTCLERLAQAEPAGKGVTLKRAWQAEGDAAIDAAQRYARLFAAELRVYRSRAGQSGAR